MLKRVRIIGAAVICATALASTARADELGSIASLKHNFVGPQTLYSFAPTPADETRQIDRASPRIYGFETKSPKTPYICTWRDPLLTEVTKGRPTKPARIFLACVFGTSAWTPPASFLREASERRHRDEGVIRVQWDFDGSRYRVSRFELEIRRPDHASEFRSVNFGDELADVRLREGKMMFPSSSSEPFALAVTASLPYRQNRGDKVRTPVVTVTLSGSAVPMPTWVLY